MRIAVIVESPLSARWVVSNRPTSKPLAMVFHGDEASSARAANDAAPIRSRSRAPDRARSFKHWDMKPVEAEGTVVRLLLPRSKTRTSEPVPDVRPFGSRIRVSYGSG